MVRRRWPEVLQTLRGLRMASWVLVSENAQVAAVEDGAVKLAFSTPQLAQTFRTGPHSEHVRRAVLETLGFDARIEPVLASEGAPSSPRCSHRRPRPRGTRRRPRGTRRARPRSEPRSATRPRPPSPAARRDASDGVPDGPEPSDEPDPGDPGEPGGAAGPVGRTGTPRGARPPRPARACARPPVPAPADAPPPAARPAPATRQRRPAPDDGSDASPDDPELAGSGLVGAPLVAQMLGGTVIDEIPDPPA